MVLVNTLVYPLDQRVDFPHHLCSHKWLRIGKISDLSDAEKTIPPAEPGRRMPQQRSDESSREFRADWYRLLVRQLFCWVRSLILSSLIGRKRRINTPLYSFLSIRNGS